MAKITLVTKYDNKLEISNKIDDRIVDVATIENGTKVLVKMTTSEAAYEISRYFEAWGLNVLDVQWELVLLTV